MSRKVYNQDIAKEFVSSDEYIQDLVFMKEYSCFYLWSGNFPDRSEGHFVKMSRDDMLRRVARFCESRGYVQNFTIATWNDIVKMVELFALKNVEHEDDKYVAFKDVLLNVETFETEPFDKNKICTTYFPYYFKDTKQKTPVFNKFLATSLVFEDDVYKTDASLVAIAQEMLGMFLLNNLKASKAFFLYGIRASNGKSQFGYVIENIFGTEQCSSLSLADLSDRWSPVSLIGKRVNIAGELDEKYGNSKMFKALVTGDRIKAEYKYGDNIFFRPKAKYVFMTNRVPTFDGFDQGVRRRIMFLPFHRHFKITDPDIDVDLEDKLKLETAGIIGWMIEGAKRLTDNKFRFTPSKASKKAMQKFDQEMSSVSMFIDDEGWVISDNEEFYIPRTDLYDMYKNWSHNVGKRPVSRNRFYDDIELLFPDITTKQRRVEGVPVRVLNLRQNINTIPKWLEEYGEIVVDDIKM